VQQECFDPALSQRFEIRDQRDQRRFSAVPAPQRDRSSMLPSQIATFQRRTSRAHLAAKNFAKTVEFLLIFLHSEVSKSEEIQTVEPNFFLCLFGCYFFCFPFVALQPY